MGYSPPNLRIAKLEIYRFRGIDSLAIDLNDHSVLIGSNGSGKSTVVDALSLVFGRDRFVRQLTEHDFLGADPKEPDRFKLVATVEFNTSDQDQCTGWFQDGRGVPKWRNPDTITLSPDPLPGARVCVQIGFAARFDRETLTVETLRYFHDDDSQVDPFCEESPTLVPAKLLADVGLLIVPALRTRDRVLSFAGETFRRLVTSRGGIPADDLLVERDRLRAPEQAIEDTGELKEIASRLDAELGRLLARKPKFQLRVNGTSSESLLQSLVAHYQFDGGVSLPVGLHGTGLLSLQTMLLLLELARSRREQDKSVVLVIEEPELHLPPGLQRRVVHRAMSASDQTITTTHSPRVASLFQAESTLMLSRRSGALCAAPLLSAPLTRTEPNGIRKLFLEGRQQTIEALMQPWVLVPEGRTDFEWLRLLSDTTESCRGLWRDDEAPFGAVVGVVPTHEASVGVTFARLCAVRDGVTCLVDGDGAGDQYARELLEMSPPPDAILQWQAGWTIENTIAWIFSGDWPTARERLATDASVTTETPDDLCAQLRAERKNGGMKGDYLAYEALAWIARDIRPCAERATEVLRAIRDAVTTHNGAAHAVREKHSSGAGDILRLTV